MKGQQEDRLYIPRLLCQQVHYVAHHNPLSGHRGPAKAYARIELNFVWLKMHGEIEICVPLRHEYQMTSPAATSNAPMGITKLSAKPLVGVFVDIVGPLERSLLTGPRYILTFVDMATRYPDGMALSSINAHSMAQVPLQVCSRFSFQETSTSDNGLNFSSRLCERFFQLLQCCHICISVYHAQSNGTMTL